MSDPGSDFGYGFQDPYDTASEFSTFHFVVRQILSNVRTAALMQVTKVTGGGLMADCYISAKPLVKITDGLNNASSHGIVNNLLVWRPRGGQGAFVCDPVVGDIGLVVVCDRDISAVKSTGAEAPPGSRRRSDFADGIYLGAMLNTALTAYIQITPTGMNINDGQGNLIEMAAAGITVTTLTLEVNGDVEVDTAATGTFTSQDGKTITVTKGIVTSIV